MKLIRRTSHFLLDKISGSDVARVRYRVRYNGNVVAFNCGVKVDVFKWSPDAERCMRNSTHTMLKIQAREINDVLDGIEDTVESVFKRFESEDKIPTVAEFKSAVNVALGRKEEVVNTTPLDRIQLDYILECRHVRAWEDSTVHTFMAMSGSLKKYKPDITVGDISLELYKDWLNWLSSGEKSSKTMRTYSAMFKAFVRWLVDNKYTVDTGIATYDYRIKSIQKPVVFLDWEELQTLKNTDFGDDTYNIIRDAYCFSAFTSLRISDIEKLTPGHVTDDELNITLKKTGVTISIAFNKHSKELFEKYAAGKKRTDKLFDLPGSSKLNLVVHDMMKRCGFNEPLSYSKYVGNKRVDLTVPKYDKLTFHSARASFVCVMLSLGVSPNVIMKFTGHKSYQSMMPYVNIARDAQKNAMKLFDNQ